jgi:hypothetical protein
MYIRDKSIQLAFFGRQHVETKQRYVGLGYIYAMAAMLGFKQWRTKLQLLRYSVT